MANSMSGSEMKDNLRHNVNKATDRTENKVEGIRDTADRLVSDAKPRIQEAFDGVSHQASDLYKNVNDWLSHGQNRTYAMIGLAAVGGILGFFVGRSSKSSSLLES